MTNKDTTAALETALRIYESLDMRKTTESHRAKLSGIRAAIMIALENLEE
jgi:hypothetical protein